MESRQKNRINFTIFFEQRQTCFHSNLFLSPTFLKAWIYISHFSRKDLGHTCCLKIGFCIIVSGFNILLFVSRKLSLLPFLIWQMDIPPPIFVCLCVNIVKKNVLVKNIYLLSFSFTVFQRIRKKSFGPKEGVSLKNYWFTFKTEKLKCW